MLRSIRDARGVSWDAWAVLPVWLESHHVRDRTTGKERLLIPAHLATGWLAFESTTGERRRASPLPDGWETLDDAALLRILERSTWVVPAHLRRAGRSPQLSADTSPGADGARLQPDA